MKTKRILSKFICALLVLVMIATSAPIMSFAMDDASVSKTTYIANTLTGVKVGFSEVEGAENYTVYRKTGDGEFEVLKTLAKPSFIDTTAENNTLYTYYAVADNETEVPDDVAEISKSIVFVESPEFTVANTEIGPKIEISPVDCAVKYDVKRAEEGSSTYKIIGTVDASDSDLSYIDSDVVDGKTYKYAVVAVVDTNYGYFRSSQIVVELAPEMTDNYTSIIYIANNCEGVKLAFNTVDDAETVTVYRKTGNYGFKPIAVVPAKVGYYIDTDVENNKLYTYDVAVTGYRFSGDAKTIKFFNAPEFTLENAGTGILVNIDPVEGATKYDIKRYDENGKYAKIATVSADTPYYFDKNVVDGASYRYFVIATDGEYISYYHIKNITTYLAAPVALSNLTNGVKVAYQKKDDAVSYTLYRKTADSDWEALKSMKKASYTYFVDSTAESGVIYYYAVEAVSETNKTGCDFEGNKIMYLASAELFISNDTNSVTIDFTSVPGAESYKIMRKPATGGSYKTIASLPASQLSYVDTNVVEGESYEYAVRAYADVYVSYFHSKVADVAVFSLDDTFDFGFGDDEIAIDLNDAESSEVSAINDEAEDIAVPAEEVAAQFDFTQIIDFVSNFVNGLNVEEGSVLETIVTVINTILGYISQILAFVA